MTARMLVLALILLAMPGFVRNAAARAMLTGATWDAEGAPAGSTLSGDRFTLTTPLPKDGAKGALQARGTMTFDTKYGTDVDLSFLSDHPWTTCEAPNGLVLGPENTIPIVCTAKAEDLAKVSEETRIYLKIDPPGGGSHRKLYWVLSIAP
ncbi:MAG: hypothetical protein FJ144_11365 [Deltaproteobacteria bacterium]|nr:hypothetical protein [Deltaproteobacteria bacterium]